MQDRSKEFYQLIDKFGLPPNDDDARFPLTQKLAETLCFLYPLEGWGLKRKISNGKFATDVVCTRVPFEYVDIWTGKAGEPNAVPQWSFGGPLVGDAEFVPVTPHNWLIDESHSDVHSDIHDDAPPPVDENPYDIIKTMIDEAVEKAVIQVLSPMRDELLAAIKAGRCIFRKG